MLCISKCCTSSTSEEEFCVRTRESKTKSSLYLSNTIQFKFNNYYFNSCIRWAHSSSYIWWILSLFTSEASIDSTSWSAIWRKKYRTLHATMSSSAMQLILQPLVYSSFVFEYFFSNICHDELISSVYTSANVWNAWMCMHNVGKHTFEYSSLDQVLLLEANWLTYQVIRLNSSRWKVEAAINHSICHWDDDVEWLTTDAINTSNSRSYHSSLCASPLIPPYPNSSHPSVTPSTLTFCF